MVNFTKENIEFIKNLRENRLYKQLKLDQYIEIFPISPQHKAKLCAKPHFMRTLVVL